ncbi:MAG TPA: class I SAM-dependent methyltransferase [Polyangiaceae bacterium]
MMERLPFPDASFDTVLCVQVLEHTPRPADLVMELARVLKNDGVLILSAPFSFRLHEEPHDYFRFSPHGLRELCARAGLEIVHIEPMGGLWTLLGHKLNTYLALQVGRAGELAQSLGKLGHEKQAAHDSTRVWTLPLVAPAMVTVALSARLLDRVIPDRTETLGFTLVGRRQQH